MLLRESTTREKELEMKKETLLLEMTSQKGDTHTSKNSMFDIKTILQSDFHEKIKLRRTASKRVNMFVLAMLFVLAVIVGIYFALKTTPVQKKYIYPYPYQAVVLKYSEARGLDSALVASVIMSESKFKERAHSHRGAIGLMQIMPETAKWIAKSMDDRDFSLEKLENPETNIRYGTWYLAHLRQEFAYNDVLTLSAYNAGRGTVHEWMNTYGWGFDFHHIEEIPYEETKNYVLKVLKNRSKYEKLYPKEAD